MTVTKQDKNIIKELRKKVDKLTGRIDVQTERIDHGITKYKKKLENTEKGQRELSTKFDIMNTEFSEVKNELCRIKKDGADRGIKIDRILKLLEGDHAFGNEGLVKEHIRIKKKIDFLDANRFWDKFEQMEKNYSGARWALVAFGSIIGLIAGVIALLQSLNII